MDQKVVGSLFAGDRVASLSNNQFHLDPMRALTPETSEANPVMVKALLHWARAERG